MIAIIALLASLLLPALGAAKARAQAASCINNVRQLGISFSLYVADYGLPLFTERNWPLMEGDWHFYLQPNYLEDSKIRICPTTREDPRKRNAVPVLTFGKAFTELHGTADLPYRWITEQTSMAGLILPSRWVSSSYGLNGWLRVTATDSRKWESLFFRTESAIEQPSLTPVFADAADFAANPVTNSLPARDLYYPNPRGAENISTFQLARHGSRGSARQSLPVAPGEKLGSWVNNIYCYDGHVERARIENLWKYSWHKEWRPPLIRPP